MDLGRSVRGPKASIEADIERPQTPELETFRELFALFDRLDANIHRLQWIGWCFLALGVAEPYSEWRTRLPSMVNDIRIGYMFGEHTVHEKGLRRKVPAGRVPDNESYRDLRPGVMIALTSVNEEAYDVMTTSGVCLQSPSGAKYRTVAKHEFPGGVGDHVLHPNRDGHCIAEVAEIFGKADIALAKLANVTIQGKRFRLLILRSAH